MKVLDPALKTIVHIPNVNSRESLKDKHREVERDHGRARILEGCRCSRPGST
jgi:hypothetical protein